MTTAVRRAASSSRKAAPYLAYTDLYGGYDGGQAKYVRVPYANNGPRKVNPDFSDEQVLFLTDIFPTGYTAIDWANVQGGETVAVFGCGPVGLMAQKVAWMRGAARVIGIDKEEYRLETARRTANSENHQLQKDRSHRGDSGDHGRLRGRRLRGRCRARG